MCIFNCRHRLAWEIFANVDILLQFFDFYQQMEHSKQKNHAKREKDKGGEKRDTNEVFIITFHSFHANYAEYSYFVRFFL